MTPLLSVRDLRIEFAVPGGVLEATRGVSFDVRPGSTVALVGESGSGKSVVAQAIMGILPKVGRVAGGQILFADPQKGGAVTDIAALDRDGPAMRAIRGGRISIIFQEPMTSLSPLHTVGDQIGEALHLHRDVGKDEGKRLARLLVNKRTMMMGNHGVLCAAPTVAEAFEDMYFLERACQTLVLAYSTGQKLNIMPHDLAEHTARGWEDYGESAFAHFEQLKQKLDRTDPSYKE